MSLRRLAMLEPVYRLAPDLLRSGRASWPAQDTAASREVRMPDFRLLLQRGGPLPENRQPHLLRGPGPGGGALGPDRGGGGRLGQGTGPKHAVRFHPSLFCTPTVVAPRRWNCAPQGTWCPTPWAIPWWAGRRRRTSGCGKTPTWRPSTAGWPTGCS